MDSVTEKLAALLQRTGVLPAILFSLGVAAFIAALLGEVSLSNRKLMLSGLLICLGAGFHFESRSGTGISYSREEQPPRTIEWGLVVACSVSFLLAGVFGYLLWTGGRGIPN